MIRIIKISIPMFIVVGILAYLFDSTSLVPLFLLFIFFHLGLYGFELLKKEIEVSLADRYFPVFLKSFSRNIEVGVSPIRALIEISKERYGEITKYFRIFKRKLESNIDIDGAFNYLSNIFKQNKKILNSLRVLNFGIRSGYGLKDLSDSLYEYILKIGDVERERKTVISQFTILFYSISIIFAIIVFILIRVLTPIYAQFTQTAQNYQPICLEIFGIYSFRDLICSLYLFEASLFKDTFKPEEAYMFSVLFNLSLLQAIFSGIIIGYGAEKSLAKSILHSTILFIIIFSFFFTMGKIGML